MLVNNRQVLLPHDQAPVVSCLFLHRFLLNGSSMEVSYASMVGMLKNTSLASAAAEGGRQWTYQTCGASKSNRRKGYMQRV